MVLRTALARARLTSVPGLGGFASRRLHPAPDGPTL